MSAEKKEEEISEAVGKGLEAALDHSRSTGAAVVTMDFHPTDGGVTITEPTTGDVATGQDVFAAMNQFFADQAVIDSQVFVDDSMKCEYCGLFPCVAVREYDNMMAIGSDLESENKSNREIRFVLYRYMSMCYNGYLGAGKRKKLPACVEGDIRDHYPKGRDDPDYVGYKSGDKNTNDE